MPAYPGFRVSVIHAILGIDDDDEESVVAFYNTREGPMPLVASNSVRLESLTALAQVIADQTGRRFKIARFSVREDIGEIKSKRMN